MEFDSIYSGVEPLPYTNNKEVIKLKHHIYTFETCKEHNCEDCNFNNKGYNEEPCVICVANLGGDNCYWEKKEQKLKIIYTKDLQLFVIIVVVIMFGLMIMELNVLHVIIKNKKWVINIDKSKHIHNSNCIDHTCNTCKYKERECVPCVCCYNYDRNNENCYWKFKNK